MDCSLSSSSLHRILQARILEWVAISSSRGIFLTQGLNQCLALAGSFLGIELPGKSLHQGCLWLATVNSCPKKQMNQKKAAISKVILPGTSGNASSRYHFWSLTPGLEILCLSPREHVSLGLIKIFEGEHWNVITGTNGTTETLGSSFTCVADYCLSSWSSFHVKKYRLGMTQRDGMGREVGGGFRMGNTCKSMADSCQCMAKTTTIL